MLDGDRERHYSYIEKLVQIKEVKGDVVVQRPSSVDASKSMRKGVKLLELKEYRQAKQIFQSILAAGPEFPRVAEVQYYIALCSIAGKRPKILRLPEVEEVERLLSSVIRANQCNRALLLLALVKEDYYRLNGVPMLPPTPEELIYKVRFAELSLKHCSEIVHHIYAPGNHVWEWLVSQCVQ